MDRDARFYAIQYLREAGLHIQGGNISLASQLVISARATLEAAIRAGTLSAREAMNIFNEAAPEGSSWQ